MSINKEEYIEKKLNTTTEELIDYLEQRLKASCNKIDKMDKTDFYKLLLMCVEGKYTVEDESDALADAFGIRLSMIDKIKRYEFHKNITNEDIKDMLMDNILGIYYAYVLGIGVILLTSPNPYETMKRILIVLGIAVTSFFIDKEVFTSESHKKLAAEASKRLKQDLSETEERIKTLEIYKKYSTKEVDYAINKLLEIAPPMGENETFDEYLQRIFPDTKDIDSETLSFLDTKKKIRKR